MSRIYANANPYLLFAMESLTEANPPVQDRRGLDRIVKMGYNDCGKTVAILTEIPVPKKRKSGRASYGRKK